MSTWSRPVLVLLCGLLLLTVSIAVLNTLVPLWLTHDALPTWQVGMVSSSYYCGNLLGTLIAGWVIKRYGFNRSYYLASLVFALATLALALGTGFWSWTLWRFVAGIGCALIWVVVESALLCNGTLRNRGRLLAAYMIIYYIGTVIGQLLVSKVSTELMHVLPWVSSVILAAVLPLVFCRVTASQEGDEETPAGRLWPMLRRRNARLGINGCIISGIVLGSLYGLMPLYLSHQGMSDSTVGYWMALLVSAGIIGQWPVGRLADRYGRLLVLRVQVFVVILGALAMLSNAAMAPALFILGCAGFTLYPVAMSWACETVAHHELVAMNQALLLSYTVGSLVGPTMTSMLMQSYSDRLLFVMIAGVAMVYLAMLLRKADHHANPVAHA
ncbi:MFS transporter [Erwinia rhapontici]|uniref:MFS transporter n=1 Tax=Erwinia rhapontici TaxID=55212 RepID=UPI00105D2D98|nr:MFS transporter [Erwinia rhapontici]MCS3605189.1 UMF2 family putative MFS family transporter [Erwinia rhapontici]TDT01425.1 UMF2 family putative MFS family transporter [Erwinia rhapontici]